MALKLMEFYTPISIPLREKQGFTRGEPLIERYSLRTSYLRYGADV